MRPLTNEELEMLHQALLLKTRPDPDLLERLLDEHATLKLENERWGERIRLLERRAWRAGFLLAGHGDHMLEPTK